MGLGRLGEYQIIYADPPWHYNDRRNKGTRFCGGAMNYYPVLKTPQICGIPVQKWAAPNSVLLMWATWPNLPEALKVIEAWEFAFKTLGFLWVKTNRKNGEPFFGIGYYSKSNSEPCLLATRGTPMKPITNGISQILEAPGSLLVSPREEHSKKPDLARQKIVELFGDVPRLEMFARDRSPGWDAWGNEIDPLDALDVPLC